jgi:hypothetical protein
MVGYDRPSAAAAAAATPPVLLPFLLLLRALAGLSCRQWVATQRTSYRARKQRDSGVTTSSTNQISTEQIRLLESVGMPLLHG